MTLANRSMDELIEGFRNRNVLISLDGERLGIRAPKGVLNEEDKRVLALNRDSLIAHLANDAPDAPFPMTEIQTAYWIGRQSHMLGGVGCHAYREFELGNLDLDRLETAWNRLVDRHDMLRAVFTEEGRQRILPSVPRYRFAREDLRQQDDPETRLAAIRGSMSHRVFDPAEWPLFDIRVSHLDGRSHLHMGLDLLIADAASILLIYREWRQFYDDPDTDLPEPRHRFAEFVRKGGPSGEAIADAEAYWRPKLADLPGPPQFPFAIPPAEIGSPKFVRQSIHLNGKDWDVVSERAREAGMTPSTLLLAVYADVLAAFSKVQHFLLTLTLFRAPPEFADVVGDFTSTLLVEADGRLPTFRERALQIQSSLAASLEHDGWSGVRVARELARLKGEADAAIPVVFTSALGHHAQEDHSTPLAWLGKSVHAITQTPQVWIDHHVIEDADGLSLSFDMVDQLFPASVADAMVAAYDRMVRALAAKGASGDEAWSYRLGAHLPQRDEAERMRANDTAADLPGGLLHAPVLAVDAQRIAIIGGSGPAGDGALSYGELHRRAAAVAAEIGRAGLRRGQLVGIALPKGPEQIVAVFAILMAGAAYLPISPAFPDQRRHRLAEQGGVKLVLTGRDQAGLSWPDGVSALCIGNLEVPKEMEASAGEAAEEDLAYVIFTSGSSGDPKGVMIEHGAAMNTIQDINRRFDITGDDAVLGLSDLGFDLSVYDIFGLLGAGGRLVLPEPDRVRDPGHWSRLLLEHRVTVWNTVPALAEMLVEHGGGPFPDLKLFLLSGDWVSVDLPQKLRKLAPNARVIALGGATEASIWSNYFDTADLAGDARSVPYGWPLANQKFHVLNESLEPCPTLVAGDLHIAGKGLARGYHGDPALTEARFFDHPVTGERLYATGDLGRYLPGGAIEFLGREDSQVKIGGHRIELGEVEAALMSHPKVQNAAVFVAGNSSHERRLVACAVVRPETAGGQSPAQAVQPEPPRLTETGERLDFRLKRLALRPVRDETTRIALPGGPRLANPPRRSVRNFSEETVPLESIAGLLASLGSVEGPDGPRLRYPSAGGAYPVQVWLHARPGRCNGLSGLYAYHPDRHDLEPVDPDFAYPVDAQVEVNRPMVEASAFAVYLVVALEAIEPLYGPLSRDFTLIETGAMTQTLMDQAARTGLGLCPVGTLDTGPLTEPLGLGEHHFLSMMLVGGLPGDGSGNGERAGDLAAELKQHAADILAAYMVPDHVALVEHIPLTVNGKVDRRALEGIASPAVRPVVDQADGTVEETVAGIFSGILGRPGIGRRESIFDLGGTSLHIVRLHRQLGEYFGSTIDIVEIFRDPTVAGIAGRLMASGAERRASDRKAADTASSRGAQRRNSNNRGPTG